MLKGKIIQDGSRYTVKVGAVTVDVTDDMRELLAQDRAEQDRAHDNLRATHADALKRYSEIQRIVLAGGAGMPTG
jgi:hypothetical protein